MKRFTLLIMYLLLACCCCDVQVRSPTSPTHDPSGIVVYYYDEGCHDEPYPYSPEWCDWYNDNTTCCVWANDDWQYEEWCQWENDFCWEYNGLW